MSVQLAMDNMAVSASVLPMLIRAMIIVKIRETRMALTGISYESVA
jgi:hypothetical protein